MQRRSFLSTTLLPLLGSLLFKGQPEAQATETLKGKRLEKMTWKEAETALNDSQIVMIPLGARLKEHGLHLPLNNDWIMAEYLAKRVLEAVPVVATPTVQFGYYPAFLDYPGSTHIQKDTFRDTIADICRSLHRHGPKKYYVLNTGVSTNRALEPARKILAAEGIWLEYTHLLEATAPAEKKVKTESAGTHADEIETSMMLYIAPEIVRMKLAQPDIHPDLGPGPLSRDPNTKTGVYSPTGAWGDPTLATREKGKVVVEALVDYLVGFLNGYASKDFKPTPELKQYL